MLVFNLGHLGEEELETARQNTPALVLLLPTLDSECFAGAGLAVRKNRSVVAEQALIDDLAAHVVENSLLLGVLLRDVVKGETFFVLRVQRERLLIWGDIFDTPLS